MIPPIMLLKDLGVQTVDICCIARLQLDRVMSISPTTIREFLASSLTQELQFDEKGSIVGITREHQLTDNAHVNWGPFWHPTGRFLIYATSEIGHHNYELYVCDADNGDATGTAKYGTRKRRITHADGFDGLPVFNGSGNWLMWTSKRETGTSQLWLARFTFDLEAAPTPSEQ